MYTFIIGNNNTDVELALTRAMMAIAAVVAFIQPDNDNHYLSYGLSILLFIAAIFAKTIFQKIPTGKWAVPLLAAVLLYFTSGTILFSLLLLGYAAIIKFLITDPVITVNERGVTIKRNYVTSIHPWVDLDNVVLKDGLLSVDLKNNTIKYFTILDDVDEVEFNRSCKDFLGETLRSLI